MSLTTRATIEDFYKVEGKAELVLCHFEIIGYSLRSFTRASSVVNCQ
jgi:hypothetical protein